MTKPFGFKHFLPAIVWAIVILALSTTAGIQMPEVVFSPDKWGHFAAYGILAWLVFMALKKSGQYNSKSTVVAVVVVSLYGVALEFVQWAFFPNRFFEVWDMVANFSGALLYYLIDRIFTTQN